MADDKIYTNVGHATAYSYAKSKGYTGTEDEFAEELAQVADNAQAVREDREYVDATVEGFVQTTVPAAVQSVTAEGTTQIGNVQTAGTTQVGNVQAEGTTQVGRVTAEGTTQVGLVTAEGTTQKNAVQAKGDEVIASIPSDYTELTEEVEDLKSSTTTNIDVVTDDLYEKSLPTAESVATGWKLTGIDGLCVQDAGYKMNKYSVTEGDTLKIVSDHLFQFQTASNVPASGTNQYLLGSTYKDGTFFIVVPDGAVWLIVSTPITSGASVEKCDSVVKSLLPIKNISYKNTGNLLDFGFIGGTWEQGSPGNTNPYQCRTKKIPVTAGKTLYGVVNGTKMKKTTSLSTFTLALWVVSYTEDNTQIGTKNLSNSDGQETGYYEIPNNCDYVVAYFTSGSWGNQFTPTTLDNAVEAFGYLGYDNLSFEDVLPNYAPYGAYNDANIQVIDNEINYWKNKKIVWFGTSIPAGVVNAGASGGNGAYPARIGQTLGATVYNESIGSSRVRGGNYHAIGDGDPMGWSGCEAIGVMLSMSLSRAEKQAIIDSWDSKWKDIMLEPEAYNPDNVSGYLNSSWDTILTKYLTGGSIGQCDLYVFDHGYNDGVITYGFSDLDEIPAQREDRTYWWGAMDFLIRKILSDNPKAKILVIGHYNYGADAFSRGANWSGKYVCDAQKAYAESWGFSCVETWKLLGLTMNTIDINGTETPVIYARYPDHLHPASDSTGYELTRYADALTPYVNMARGT